MILIIGSLYIRDITGLQFDPASFVSLNSLLEVTVNTTKNSSYGLLSNPLITT